MSNLIRFIFSADYRETCRLHKLSELEVTIKDLEGKVDLKIQERLRAPNTIPDDDCDTMLRILAGLRYREDMLRGRLNISQSRLSPELRTRRWFERRVYTHTQLLKEK